MIALSQWARENGCAAKAWLLIGKGPSFGELGNHNIQDYSSIAINHTVCHLPHVECASVIDVSIFKDVADCIYKNASFLLMPRYPHEDPDVLKVPPRRPLEEFVKENEVLQALDKEGRLVWYNLASGPDVPGEPRIESGHFSAEVLVKLLARIGVKTIRTIGVDGGVAYAPAFEDLKTTTLLANGQPAFDVQAQGIARTALQYGVDFAPMNQPDPIRIYIGADESQMLGARVLEYSIRRLCPAPVEFDTMQDVNPRLPKDAANQPRTQFSFRRFAIPAKAGFKGRAVYLDADMQVFRDFRELWDTPFDGATVLYAPSSDPARPSQFSVLLLDCSRLNWDVDKIMDDLDAGRFNYDGLMKEMQLEPESNVRAGLSPHWNSLEGYIPGQTGLIHYTDMHTQPWVYARNKNGDLWVAALQEAIYDKFISWDEVNKAVRDGYARPSLALQLKISRRIWKIFNKTLARVMDARFQPHVALQKRLASTAPGASR